MPADLFEPDASSNPRGVVVFLHDFDAQTLRQSEVFTAELARARTADGLPDR